MVINKTVFLCQIGKNLFDHTSFKCVVKEFPNRWQFNSQNFASFNYLGNDNCRFSDNKAKSKSYRLPKCRISSTKTNLDAEKIFGSLDGTDKHVCLRQGLEKFDETNNAGGLREDQTGSDLKEFHPQKALVLTKLSRYQFERQQYAKDLSEGEFRRIMEKRGSDYTQIKYYHNVHKSVEEKLVQALEKKGLEVKLCQPMNYDDNLIEWSDLIVTAGGDGTFLLGASKIKNRNQQPIMGVNTDPTRSEGHLCLPKHWSLNVDDAIQSLLDGKV